MARIVFWKLQRTNDSHLQAGPNPQYNFQRSNILMIRGHLFRGLAVRSIHESALDDATIRAAHRNRRTALSGSASMLARLVQIGSSLVTVPLTLKYLGNERFGLWMTISSVLAMAAFADFGVGNGVMNSVATAFGRDDILGIRKAISSGMAVLSVIAASTLTFFLMVYPFVNWAHVFRVTSPQAMAEAGPALLVFASCFALNIALDVVQRVQLGIQQGYRYGLWQMCGSMTGLLAVLLGVQMHASLPELVAALAGAPVVSTLLNAVHFFGFSRPDLRPAHDLVSRETISQIARLGALFFVLQVVVSFAYSADNFIIAHTLGAVNVTEYAIPQRMFALVSMMSGMLLTPLWPAYGEAISRGDMGWVRRTLRRSLTLVLGASIGSAVILLLLSHQLIYWWVGSRIQPPFALLLGMAIWSIMDCCGNAIAMFLNGASVIKFQIIVALMFGVGCVASKLIFVRYFGLVAVPWSTIISYGLLNMLPCLFFVPKAMRGLELKSPALSIVEAITFPLAALHEGEEA